MSVFRVNSVGLTDGSQKTGVVVMGKQKLYADGYKCPVCGKEFVCYMKDMWAYKGCFGTKELVFCSWGCMQKMRRAHESRRRKRKNDG